MDDEMLAGNAPLGTPRDHWQHLLASFPFISPKANYNEPVVLERDDSGQLFARRPRPGESPNGVLKPGTGNTATVWSFPE